MRLTLLAWGPPEGRLAPRPARTILRRVRVGLVALNLLAAALVGVLLWQLRGAELRHAQHQAWASVSPRQPGIGATPGQVAVPPARSLQPLADQASDDTTAAWQRTAAWVAGLTLLLVAASLVIDRLVRTSLARQNQVQALYDTAPCGYHALDARGRYLSINATELGWLGCTRDEVLGQLGPADFFTDEGRTLMADAFPRFQQTGRLDQLTLDLVGRQGITRRVVVTATAVTDSQGGFMNSNSVMHDITALHAVQHELAARSREQQAMLDTGLVGMLKVRAGLITWTNAEMDRIFGYGRADWAGMPIARLFGDEACYRQTAQRIAALSPGGGTFREDQQLRRRDGSAVWVDVSTMKIDPSGAESFTIVKDITDRKQEEALRLHTIELAARNDALRQSGQLKDEFLSHMSHELRTPLNAVIGFSHLAGNAIKFSRVGGAVSLRAWALDAQRWCVEVSDEGIGISADDLSRLFVPFMQLSSGSTKAYGGTGMGLALVRRIAQAQGGDVTARSELGKGSVFTLVLPRSLASGAATA